MSLFISMMLPKQTVIIPDNLSVVSEYECILNKGIKIGDYYDCMMSLIAFTATVGVMEVSSAATGKDWWTERKLNTNERWLRDVLGFVDVAPVAKGLHAFGNLTTGLKSGVSTTTIKGASKVGLEEGGWGRSFLQRG
ncbi:hypothetical protein CN966_27090 [Bacillus cereus]|nr:hypothetical protein CN966_27090 [Bacillus cereus]